MAPTRRTACIVHRADSRHSSTDRSHRATRAVLTVGLLLPVFTLGCGQDNNTPQPAILRASVATGGVEAVGGISGTPAVSGDGRIVAFASLATNLVPNDTNGQADVFVYDVGTGQTTRVSVVTGGGQATGGSSRAPALSADGRYVAFESDATNLVANDTNTATDIFVHDRVTGETSRVSLDNSGAQTIGFGSFSPAISADGAQVAFVSSATNLVLADTNGLSDIFVRDRNANVTTRVSVVTGGGQATGPTGSTDPSLSADGRYVAFASAATNLVSGDTNGRSDIFVHDRVTGTTERVSLGANGAQATGGDSEHPSINGDATVITFDSTATNLVSGDTNGLRDVFVRDRSGNATSRVSVGAGGAQATGDSSLRNGALSQDGRFVAFRSAAANLVSDDTNNATDIFAHDRTTNLTTRQSLAAAGEEATGNSTDAVISGNGAVIVFDSDAGNLVPQDTNNLLDVFLVIRR